MTPFAAPLPSTFATQYASLLAALLSPAAASEVNTRTGEVVSFIPSGATLTTYVGKHLPLIDVRKTRPRTAAAEVKWFLSGDISLDVLHDHDVHIWDQFAENGRHVSSAYGYRWRKYFERDQITEAVEALREDYTNRRVYVSAWDPGKDGMMRRQLNTPCPVGFTLATSPTPGPGAARELNSTLLLRSSDVFVGLPYDVMGHAMLMGLLAAELGMRPGWLTACLAHPHLYFEHRLNSIEALRKRGPLPSVRLSPASMTAYGDLVEWYAAEQVATQWPAFDPSPRVIP